MNIQIVTQLNISIQTDFMSIPIHYSLTKQNHSNIVHFRIKGLKS